MVGCGTEEALDGTDTDDVVSGWDITTRAPFVAPEDPLVSAPVDSCAVIDATRCEGGQRQVCAPYDVSVEAFVEAVDPTLLRAWRYDRWYDLHHSPDGQTSDRSMTEGRLAGTPEADWADPAIFRSWDGFGDSAIWTGVATHGAMLRWLTTGTEADRRRFEDKVRVMLTQFEVTDAVGYLARAHFLIVPDGTPTTPDHLTLTATQADDVIRFEARDPSSAPDLPAGYAEGVPDGDGGTVMGTVGWQGNPSIDQYTGAMVTLPAAWSLLDDEGLRARIADQLVGYLHRLERVEIRNLQGNPDLAEAAAAALGGAVELDGELDIAALDTIVLYALPAYNHRNEDSYSRLPPAAFPREATVVLDAGDAGFLPDLFTLVAKLQQGWEGGWDHIYVPSVRGGDAVHMMHLATMAWHMTGDDRYRDFLTDELLDTIGTDDVANTLGALVLPPWCRAFYGDHITIPPLWALLNLLDDGPLRDRLVQAMVEEGGARLNAGLGNAKFDLMVADAMADDPAGADTLRADALALLEALGGNGGVLDDPRRTYNMDLDAIEEALGEPLALMCPTPEERARCEDGFEVLGVNLPGETITFPCVEHPLACDMGDGTCAWALSAEPLPPALRRWQDFLWQRSPFEVGAQFAPEGAKSSPGLDLTESYWLARARGAAAAHAQVLAWQDLGSCD